MAVRRDSAVALSSLRSRNTPSGKYSASTSSMYSLDSSRERFQPTGQGDSTSTMENPRPCFWISSAVWIAFLVSIVSFGLVSVVRAMYTGAWSVSSSSHILNG